MFSKVPLNSFGYDFIDKFCFPTEEIQEIYNQSSIIKCHLYLNLTDTGSCSIFMFVCEIDYLMIKESETIEHVSISLSKSEVRERLDTSDEFYKKFAIHDSNLKKQTSLYEKENINNPNICTIAINTKEYFQKFGKKSINKKQSRKKRYKRNLFWSLCSKNKWY